MGTVMLSSCDSPTESAYVDSQTLDTIDFESIDRAIRASGHIKTVVGDVQLTIEGHRPAYVEDEPWGVSAILRLSEADRLNGPWLTVDSEALPDYVVRADTYEVDTALLYVTIQPQTGKILTLVPFEEPPDPWDGAVPKYGPGPQE